MGFSIYRYPHWWKPSYGFDMLWPEIEHTPTLPFKAGIVQATLAWKGPFFFQSFETNNAVKGPHSTTARASRASRCVGQRAFAGSTHKELLALLHKANHGADKGPRGQFQWWTKTHAFFLLQVLKKIENQSPVMAQHPSNLPQRFGFKCYFLSLQRARLKVLKRAPRQLVFTSFGGKLERSKITRFLGGSTYLWWIFN